MLVIGGLFPAGRIWSLFCLNTSVTLTHPPSLPPSQYRRNIIFRKDLSSATAVIFSAVWSLMFVSCCLYFLVARVTAVLALAVWWLQCQGQCGCQSLQSLQSLQTARGSIRRQTSADSRTNTNITSYILARLSLSLSLPSCRTNPKIVNVQATCPAIDCQIMRAKPPPTLSVLSLSHRYYVPLQCWCWLLVLKGFYW